MELKKKTLIVLHVVASIETHGVQFKCLYETNDLLARAHIQYSAFRRIETTTK